MAKEIVETPLMKQYFEMKAKHPDAVLLFRVGDFYETFSSDAITASEILGITLTRRANGVAQSVELAGFPHHALDTYLPKLVRAGKRVAICEQLEDPKLTKKLVKRGITELVTPGVSINDNILNHRENNFLAAVHFGKKAVGVAFLDISTGEFLTAEGTADYVDKLLGNFAPKEVLIERSFRQQFNDTFTSRYLTFELEDWIFTEESATDRLLKHFETRNLKGFGIASMHSAIVASGAILCYLDITQHTHIGHITALSRIEEERYVRLDKFTVRNLELLDSMCDDGKSLLSVIDRTLSPMGARLLRRWLLFPLKDVPQINSRLDVVEHFFRDTEGRELLKQQLEMIGDIERLISKVAVARITPRELVQLKNSLVAIAPVKELCSTSGNEVLRRIGEQLNPCSIIRDRIEREINPDAPNQIQRGNVIRDGVNSELDELRSISHSSKDYLMKMQQRESEITGIPSLKIGFNNVFGYYIEVRNTHKEKVPQEWIRKQTLVSAERYVTQELKDYEEKIIGAEDRIQVLEQQLFNELVNAVSEYIPAIQLDSNLIARLDCLSAFTRVAIENHYNRPVLDDSLDIDIVEGRHPVIERQLPLGERYVSNSIHLGNDSQQIIMITGPNMAGKSALLRQTALITLMAQIGSFVPASQVHTGVVDSIFTRVGAADDLSAGKSTFMVEMTEVAEILENATPKSLVILDEIGRGTSTFDGMSIARAVVEYMASKSGHLGCKTLFATHYHELTDLEDSVDGVKNYNIAVKKRGDDITFLRRIVRGGADGSYGIEVAKLAGVPNPVVQRAKEILKELEEKGYTIPVPTNTSVPKESQAQMTFGGGEESEIVGRLRALDVNTLTPIEALTELFTLSAQAKNI